MFKSGLYTIKGLSIVENLSKNSIEPLKSQVTSLIAKSLKSLSNYFLSFSVCINLGNFSSQ